MQYGTHPAAEKRAAACTLPVRFRPKTSCLPNPAKSFLCRAFRSPTKCPTRFPSASARSAGFATAGPGADAPPDPRCGISRIGNLQFLERSAKAFRVPGSEPQPDSVSALSSVALLRPPHIFRCRHSKFCVYRPLRKLHPTLKAPRLLTARIPAPLPLRELAPAPAPPARSPVRPAARTSQSLRRTEIPFRLFPASPLRRLLEVPAHHADSSSPVSLDYLARPFYAGCRAMHTIRHRPNRTSVTCTFVQAIVIAFLARKCPHRT